MRFKRLTKMEPNPWEPLAHEAPGLALEWEWSSRSVWPPGFAIRARVLDSHISYRASVFQSNWSFVEKGNQYFLGRHSTPDFPQYNWDAWLERKYELDPLSLTVIESVWAEFWRSVESQMRVFQLNAKAEHEEFQTPCPKKSAWDQAAHRALTDNLGKHREAETLLREAVGDVKPYR